MVSAKYNLVSWLLQVTVMQHLNFYRHITTGSNYGILKHVKTSHLCVKTIQCQCSWKLYLFYVEANRYVSKCLKT
jgi:hypothetical protein